MNINGDMILYDDLEKHQHKVLKDIVALLNYQYTSTILLGVNKKDPHLNMGFQHPSWMLAINSWIEQERIIPNPVKNINIRGVNGILDIEISPGNDAPYRLTAKKNKKNQKIYIRENARTRLVSLNEFKQLYKYQ
ncbi:AlbA family DNA-binding domain-containing protein [Fundicoccus sp. Sow4_D5]|uniref:AlbA family DNA-binding domain-containing protein n=1 Tax=Fundicoccus sp. Sow4_D5 TaxID=3438782 RepID=UPI003F936B39